MLHHHSHSNNRGGACVLNECGVTVWCGVGLPAGACMPRVDPRTYLGAGMVPLNAASVSRPPLTCLLPLACPADAVQALSFMFEYIGEMGKDYIYAVTPLLEDALMDRDLVHRQTAAAVVQHLSLGIAGLGCEDALTHLLNYVWPNIFEVSPHIMQTVTGAIDGCRVALGPAMILNYVLQGLFHPARKVRETYWRLYNNLYIGAQDALVASLPNFDDDGSNTYARHELSVML